MFMPLKEKTLVFTMFLQCQGRKSSKTSLFYTVSVENTVFCDVVSTRSFKCTANTTVFFMCLLLPALKANQPKTLVLTDNTKKTQCFETIFHNFSVRAPPFKKPPFFTLFLPEFIRTQEGVKSEHFAKLHLNSTSCCRKVATPKIRGGCLGPKCCKLWCFYERTMHYVCKASRK